METCATRISKALSIRGMRQVDLAEKTGIPKSAISQYCSGSFKPKQKRLFLIAEALKVDEAWLMGLDVPMEKSRKSVSNIAPMPETEKKPRIGRIACGDPIIAEENIETYDEVLSSWHADFTLMCIGDSMSPKIENGDIVAIRAQPTVENGEIAAVRIGDEATLKRVFLHADYIELRPINPNYDSIIRSKSEMEDIRIEGRAVGLCRNL